VTYRKIRVEDKVAAVKRVLWGESVSSVATAMGVCRNSLAVWVRNADSAMRSTLGARKQTGRRKARGDNVRLRKLKAKIAQQEQTIKAVCHYLKISIEGPVPSPCARCGCARYYKNGFFMIDIAHLLGKSLHGKERKIPVQKFVCVNCEKSTRLDGPAALFHWATSDYGVEREKSRRVKKRNGRKKNLTRPAIMMRMMTK
jgi:hypothetical protein